MDFLGAALRHYRFLLQGLEEVSRGLAACNIPFQVLSGEPALTLPRFLNQQGPAMLITDFDPLRIKTSWKKSIGAAVSCRFFQVDAHNVVPAWLASPKKEYAARTFRPKFWKAADTFFSEYPALINHPFGRQEARQPFDSRAAGRLVKDRSVAEVGWITPGERAARSAMKGFLRNGLAAYPGRRNNPCLEGQSNLSPYLHFGHLAPQRLALEVRKAKAPEEAKAEFLEELLVRRELADNFCLYEPEYDRFAGFPEWARKTLDEHRTDRREYLYSPEEFDQGRTDDPLWNACQLDLRARGKLHGYLRMYWAKKILEWSAGPEEALQTAIRLNDRYSLDGRDPNGYTGIAWSVGGVHDRAWSERPVFGKIRYMSRQGCARKFDVNAYISRVREQSREE
jgi:deoxyribodipyrimidine photo-lyase